MAVVIKFYKDDGLFYFRDVVVPESSLTVGFKDDTVIVRNQKGHLKFAGPLENIRKKDNSKYATNAELLSALDGFFKQDKANIQEELGIDVEGGDEAKVLSEKGTFVELPEVSEAIDVLEEIGIDEVEGLETKVLSEKGTFVELPVELKLTEVQDTLLEQLAGELGEDPVSFDDWIDALKQLIQSELPVEETEE